MEKHKFTRLLKSTGEFTWIHWCVIFASFLLTLTAWYISKKAVEEKIANTFDRESSQIVQLLSERMQKYEDTLWASVAAINANGGMIDYFEWKVFANSLRIETKYPGINGIGVIYNIETKLLPGFLEKQRESRPGFSVYPEHNKNELWPITYIEPVAKNVQAVGLDIAHEDNRYSSAIKSRDTGLAQITGPIVLVQDSSKTPGFLFYAPYYKSTEIDTLASRRENFAGLVYAPFVVKSLLEGTLEKEKRHIGIRIRDGDEVLYDEHSKSESDYDSNPLFSRNVSLELYGRSWVIDLRSTLDFRTATTSHLPKLILFFGLLIESLLIALFFLLARHNRIMASQLKSSEASLNEFIEVSGDGYWDWYIQEDYEYMSPRFWEIFGYSPSEMPHSPSAWQSLIFEEDLRVVLNHFKRHVDSKGEYPYEQEVRYRHKNGSTVTVLCKGRVVEWDKQDKPIRMIGTHTDITDRKESSLALQKALDFQKLLINVNTDLFFVKDREFRIVEANEAFLSLYTDERRDRIIGSTLINDHNNQQLEDFISEDIKAFEEGVSEVFETIDFPDGTTRTLLTKKIRFEDVTGAEFILAVARDVTEIKEAEKELVRMNSELEEFAYRTSHDLRSPLISSSKLLNIIEEKINNGDTAKAIEYIGIVKESLSNLTELVSDILTMTKHDNLEVEPEGIDIQAMVKESLVKLSHLEGFDRLHVEQSYDACQPLVTQLDHMRLIVENLISNAIKYQDFKNASPFLHISTQVTNGLFSFSVSDNGLGVPKSSRQKLFLMFKRLHPNTSFGSGLGLYMVKKSVDRIGATIEYVGKEQGSQFVVLIPLRQHQVTK